MATQRETRVTTIGKILKAAKQILLEIVDQPRNLISLIIDISALIIFYSNSDLVYDLRQDIQFV